MANSNVSTRDTQLEKQRLGYIALSFSNMDNTSEPKIQAGSVVEIAGTLYSVTGEESNSDWSGISNGTQTYLILDPASDGSSFSAKWTTAAPVWSEAKYGYYGDGTNEDADNRYVLGVYKDSSGNYTEKRLYAFSKPHNILQFPGLSSETLSSAGSSSWVVPAGVYRVKATILGAGGGGGGGGNSGASAGSDGGDTKFNSITAAGGGGGTDPLGNGLNGKNGFVSGNNGKGGRGFESGTYYVGGDANGGEIVITTFSVTPGASISYTVGSGGSGGSGDQPGGDGGDGEIVLVY